MPNRQRLLPSSGIKMPVVHGALRQNITDFMFHKWTGGGPLVTQSPSCKPLLLLLLLLLLRLRLLLR